MIGVRILTSAWRWIGAGAAAALLVLTFTVAAAAQDGGAQPSADAALPRASEPGDASVPTAALPAADATGPTASVPQSAPANAAPEAAAADAAPLRFAVLAGRSVTDTMAAVDPIAKEIGAIINRPVELLAMATYRAMIDAQVERRIDGGFYSASAYALAQSRCNCLTPIAAPRASDGTTAYYAVIVAKADSGIASSKDLAGKTIAVGAPDSIGARRMQLAGLMAAGIDPSTFFGGVLQVASANKAVLSLRDGKADAAFAWSSLSGDAASGYSLGTLAQLAASGAITPSDYVVIWRSAPITHGPFAVLSSLSGTVKDKIGSYLLALEASRPAAYEKLNPFYGGGYAPVAARDYAGLEALTSENVDAVSLPKPAAPVAPASGASPSGAGDQGTAAAQ